MVPEKFLDLIMAAITDRYPAPAELNDDIKDQLYELNDEEDVYDPPRSWEIVEDSPIMSKSELIMVVPKNDFFYGGEKEHTIKICIDAPKKDGEYIDEFNDDAPILIVTKVYVDNVTCEYDVHEMNETVYTIMGNGFAPDEYYLNQ